MTFGQAVASVVFGRLGDRYGHRLGMLASVIFQIVTLGLVLAAAGPVSCVAAYVAAGISRGAILISGMNLLFETCPHDSRMAHITVGNFLISGVSIGAPLLAGTAVEWWSLPVVFLICLIFSAIALVWTGLLMHDPRKMSKQI